MPRTARPILALLLAALAGAAACKPKAVPSSALHSASSLRDQKLPWPELERKMNALAQANAPRASLLHYGKSTQSRELIALRLEGPANAGTSNAASRSTSPSSGKRPAILISQGIHGDEYAGLAEGIVDQILAPGSSHPGWDDFFAQRGVLYVIPSANPDGYMAWKRENANGVDLNYDFPVDRYPTVTKFPTDAKGRRSPTQIESKQLIQALESWMTTDDAQLRLFLDIHCCEDDKYGALMHPWGDTKTLDDGSLPAADVARYKQIAQALKSIYPTYFFGSGIEMVEYETEHTDDDYIYRNFPGSLTLCYETRTSGEDAATFTRFLDQVVPVAMSGAAKTEPSGDSNGGTNAEPSGEPNRDPDDQPTK